VSLSYSPKIRIINRIIMRANFTIGCFLALLVTSSSLNAGSPVIKYLESKIDQYGRVYYTCPSDLPEGQVCFMKCVTITFDSNGVGQIGSQLSGVCAGEPTYFPEDALACTAWIE
jgi:hypothetical protein